MLQKFLDDFPADSDVRQATPAQLERYHGRLPKALLELWEKTGLGHYGGGLIELIDPEDYKSTLQSWLMLKEENRSRIPIAVSAFGILFYYRDLGKGAEDVAYIDPRTSESGVLAWSLDGFFNEFLGARKTRENLLEQAQQRLAAAECGPLRRNEIYGLEPAQRLGGSYTMGQLHRSDAVVYLNILLALALGGAK